MDKGLPVSSGFTYARIEHAAQRSDWMLVHQVHQFLRKWLIDHQQILSNEVYIGGDSYSGISIPVIVQEISQGNEKGVKPWINLQGYLLGNPSTTRREDNYKIPFAHGMTLISDELYESLQKNCKGEYINVDTRNALCSRDMESFHEATSGHDLAYILDSSCEWDDSETSSRRSLEEFPKCSSQIATLKLSAWIRSLNYSIVDDWRPWLTNGQVAGYTSTYSNRMTFATVKGGGHPAPEFKPEECFAMYSRWISNKVL
ncbi:hypothetical protein GLYMA_06G181700v4 [Glycine max]|nr:hypothetical protein GLYMA_06G181700v4 [Glycine max]